MKKIIIKSKGKYVSCDEFSPTSPINLQENPSEISLFDSIQQAADFMERYRNHYSGPYEILEIILP